MPRILVAVTHRDGRVELENVGRPGALVAFGDHFGKSAPTTYKEVAWLAHRALARDRDFDEWLDELDDLTSTDAAVEAARRQLAGQLSALEQLEKLTGPEVLALVDEAAKLAHDAGLTGDPDGDYPVPELVQAAQGELAEQRAEAEAELERQQAELAGTARGRLAAMTEAELGAMAADELEQLQAEAVAELGATQPDPTTRPPATAGATG